MAAAQQEQAGIQRRHRVERRHGDDPSQTPPFISLVACHEISQGTEEPPPQHPLQSVGLLLPEIQPRLSRRGRPPLPDGAIDPPLPENQPRGRSLRDGAINPALTGNQPRRTSSFTRWWATAIG